MKKFFLLLIFIFPVTFTFAQNADSIQSCSALFKYEKKDMLMSPLPAVVVHFFDKSEGEVDGWFWEFGDGETSYEQNPMHIYHAIYGLDGNIIPFSEVKLTIITPDSCISSYSDTVWIFNEISDSISYCRADFKYYHENYDSLNNLVTIQFTNLSEGDSLNYLWDFGNGETSNEMEPKVTYKMTSEMYEVCLQVSGPGNCSSRSCHPVYTKFPVDTIIEPDSTDCFVYFGYSVNYDIQTFAPALVLDFYSKAENVIEYKWDFGDGNTSNEPNPTHIFNLPLDIDSDSATYVNNLFREVCLTVQTESGCVAKWCQTIYLLMNDSINPEPKPECHAWIKYYRRDEVVSIPEAFQYRFIDASEGKVVSRLWEFEDGTTSTEEIVDKSFYFLSPPQKVCLTVFNADSCQSSWCETIFINDIPRDSVSFPEPESAYSFRFEAYFPVWMSSCAGTVKAWVYYKDSLINASNFVWSNGAEGQEASGFCPTQTYSVKAITPNGMVISETFVFNADGTVTVIPVNWWIFETNNIIYISTDKKDDSFSVHWTLCDGTVLVQDSVPLSLINCGNAESNMVLTDSMGNVVYYENISLKAVATWAQLTENNQKVELFPNPVNDVLNIVYTGITVEKLQIIILDIIGKTLIVRDFYVFQNGQKISIDVNSLKSGIYVCKIVADNKTLHHSKIVK